jgi:hypothetical protein
MADAFGMVKLPPEIERSVIGIWLIDFSTSAMTRTIEFAVEQYFLVSRLLDRDGNRIGGDDGLALERVTETEYRGTGRNQCTYQIDAQGNLLQFVPGDREPSMVASRTNELWPG